jgi:MtN3 and saliva related transmembrane protein
MEQEPLVVMFNLNNTNLTQEEYFILENVIGYTLNILIFAMLTPQIYKAYKNKMTDDISYKFIWISLVAEVLEILYGILINQIPVLLTGIICMIQMILLYIAKKLYDSPQDVKIQRRTSIQDSKLIEIGDITQTILLKKVISKDTQTILLKKAISKDTQSNIITWDVKDEHFIYTFRGPSNLYEIDMSTQNNLYDIIKCINININNINSNTQNSNFEKKEVLK